MFKPLKINIKLVFRFIGAMLVVFGLFMALCIPLALLFNDTEIWSIVVSALITVVTGLFVRIMAGNIKENDIISNKEAYLIVTFGWIAIIFAGTLPYLFSSSISDVSDAVFESVSGLTATGATVFRDVESLTPGILLWRSLSQWLGGMGFVMLIISLIPVLGTGGLKVMSSDILDITSEKPGKTFIKSIRKIWIVYTLLTIVTAVVYKLGGMDSFDAVCHAFTTLSTGGFSTHNNNISYFSPQLQYIIVFFMFIAGANFPLIVKALTAKPSSLFKSQELRYYFFIVCFVSMIISSVLVLIQGYEIKTAIREALFQVTSFISTTGYVVADYTLWIPPLWLILFFLMLIGSCSGSSGGGIKIMRQMILLKNTSNSIKNIVNPNAVFGVRIDGKIINQDIIYNVLAYCFIYLISFAIGSFLISLIGMDFKSAIGIAASAIGNIGPGLGYPGSLPVYDTLPVAGKWIMCALMFIGRLEFFTVFILFFPSFWKK